MKAWWSDNYPIVLIVLAGTAFVAALILPIALSPDPRRPCCMARDGKEVATCMIACASAANPKSDEEGEDLVQRCTWDCKEAHCTRWKAITVKEIFDLEAECVAAGGLP